MQNAMESATFCVAESVNRFKSSSAHKLAEMHCKAA